MAQVKVSGAEGTITVSNPIARQLAEKKKRMSDDEQKETWVEIGSWQGYLSKVTSILIEKEKQYPAEDYSRKLTREEKIARAGIMKEVRAKLEDKGVIRPLKGNAIIENV